MEKSFISELRIFFNGLFCVFFPLGLWVIYTGFKSDAQITIENSFQDNLEKIRNLEEERLRAIENLQKELQEKLQIKTKEQLIYVRNNISGIRDEILSRYLVSLQELREPDQLVLLLPFRMQKSVFLQKASVLQSFFSSGTVTLAETHLPMERDFSSEFTKELMSGFNELLSRNSALNIFNESRQSFFLQRPEKYALDLEFKINLSERQLSLSPADWAKLDQLDGSSDFRYRDDQDFNFNWYRLLLDVYEQTFIHTTEGEIEQNPSAFARTLTYLIRFIWKEHGHLGLCQFSDHRIWRDGFFFRQDFSQPGTFFQSRVGDKIHSYFWDIFPDDYFLRSPDKNELPIFPQEMLGGLIDEVLLGYYLLKKITIENKPDFSFLLIHNKEKSVNSLPVLKDVVFHNNNWQEEKGGWNFLPIEELEYWDSASGSFTKREFSSGAELKTQIARERELALQWYDDDKNQLWGSAVFSVSLGNAFIVLYQPAQRFLCPFYGKWLLTLFLYLCSIPLFLIVRNRFLYRFRLSLGQCIEFCALAEDMELTKAYSSASAISETGLLVNKMQEFNQAIKERILQIQLVFGFQNILNKPNKTFNYYKEEFFYFLRDLGEHFRWELLTGFNSEIVNNGSLHKIELSAELLDYMKEAQKLSGPFAVKFTGKRLPSEAEQEIICEYFIKLAEKSRLEESFMYNQLLQQDLELSKPVLASLLPAISEWRAKQLYVSVQSNENMNSAGEFAELRVLDKGLIFCFCSPTMKGLGAGLYSSCLKSFWQCCQNEPEQPQKILLKCHDFIFHRGFETYFSGMITGFIDAEKNILHFAAAGLPLFSQNDKEGLAVLLPDSPPIGFCPGFKSVKNSRPLFWGETIYLFSGLSSLNYLKNKPAELTGFFNERTLRMQIKSERN